MQLEIVGSTVQLQIVGSTVQRVISAPQTTLNSTCLRKVCIVYYVQESDVEGHVCASSASDNEHSLCCKDFVFVFFCISAHSLPVIMNTH